ncbi:MAG: patatin-like phospholipase family protein [Variibacter sp.]|nr:patatin-like phospholipase family protein [Variibacter sp.]
MRLFIGLVVGLAVALAGCGTVSNLPINVPTADPQGGLVGAPRVTEASEDDLLVALAFSGGGTRAAAFSFGVLQGLAATAPPGGRRGDLLDHIDFITGVSGGSITAAYYGLRKRAALADFRERFLLRDGEEALRTSITLGNLGRALGGGVNEDTRLRGWLDANLFEGATFSALLEERRPRIWINATDIYNRTPFVFGKTAFSAICSDLSSYPIAGAVAASAAVPLAFAPVVLETFPRDCDARLPSWITRALAQRDAPPMLKAFAQGVSRYRDGSIRYIKLLDGGLADNFGLSGFTVARESAEQAYAPLTPSQARKLRRVLFLVVDAGRGPQGDWARTLEGPTGADLVSAVTDSALDVSLRANYTAFSLTMDDWRKALLRWRCGPGQRVRAAGRLPACQDLRFFIGRVRFDDLAPARAAELNKVPTRLKLPPETVDAVVAAGRDALATNPTFRAFLRSM